MKYLIICPCSHPMDAHHERGCRGTDNSRCGCPRSEEESLEAAITEAASTPWSPAVRAARESSAA
jgi:hypothetical protein